jgi:hypothetical protein
MTSIARGVDSLPPAKKCNILPPKKNELKSLF